MRLDESRNEELRRHEEEVEAGRLAARWEHEQEKGRIERLCRETLERVERDEAVAEHKYECAS